MTKVAQNKMYLLMIFGRKKLIYCTLYILQSHAVHRVGLVVIQECVSTMSCGVISSQNAGIHLMRKLLTVKVIYPRIPNAPTIINPSNEVIVSIRAPEGVLVHH